MEPKTASRSCCSCIEGGRGLLGRQKTFISLDPTSKCNFGNWSNRMSCGSIHSVTQTINQRSTDEHIHAAQPARTIPDLRTKASRIQQQRHRSIPRSPQVDDQPGSRAQQEYGRIPGRAGNGAAQSPTTEDTWLPNSV